MHLASGVATELPPPHSTPGYSSAGSPMRPASFSLSRRSGDAVADELRAHLSSTEDPATRAALERAEAARYENGAAFAEAKATKEEVERLRLSIAADEAKAAREEVERLRRRERRGAPGAWPRSARRKRRG